MTGRTRRRSGLSPVQEAAYRRLAGSYPLDPVGYSADVLSASLLPRQADVLAAVLRGDRRVLVPSANNVGKSFVGGVLVNWHHDSHDPGIVLCTSSTARQVELQLFKEVRRLRPFLLNLYPRAPAVRHTATHFVRGYSTNRPDAFQGFHEGAVLLVFDESTGIPGELFDRARTMFKPQPGFGWVCFYNPNDPTSHVYSVEQGGGWEVVRLSALDHPNVVAELRGEPPPVPAAIDLHTVRERIEKECEDCGHTREEGAFEFPTGSDRWYKPVRPEFNPQVRGRWPDQATDAVWSAADRARCEARTAIDPEWPVQIGCDVARFGGNRTTMAVRKGVALVHLEEHTHWPTRRVSQHIADRLRELAWHFAPPGVSPKAVPCVIDDSGGYGAGVTDHPEGYTFVGVVASETARNPQQYPNKRSELWFLSRLAADEGGFLTGHCPQRDLVDQLWQELTATRYSLDRKGRRVCEGKDALKERLRRSPDLADAVNLSWFPV